MKCGRRTALWMGRGMKMKLKTLFKSLPGGLGNKREKLGTDPGLGTGRPTRLNSVET